MTNYEIAYEYSHAKDRTEQTRILSELTDSDVDTIIEILKDEGVYKEGDINYKTCSRCGCKYISDVKGRKGLNVCERCRTRRKRMHKNKWLKLYVRLDDYRKSLNPERRDDLIRVHTIDHIINIMRGMEDFE